MSCEKRILSWEHGGMSERGKDRYPLSILSHINGLSLHLSLSLTLPLRKTHSNRRLEFCLIFFNMESLFTSGGIRGLWTKV